MKLYRVTTLANQFSGCNDVRFHWFRCTDDAPRPCAEFIEGYDPTDRLVHYAEGAVDELFTAIEASALKEYVDREYGADGTTTIEEVRLPIPNNEMGLRAIPVGGGNGCYMLYKEPRYACHFELRDISTS